MVKRSIQQEDKTSDGQIHLFKLVNSVESDNEMQET